MSLSLQGFAYKKRPSAFVIQDSSSDDEDGNDVSELPVGSNPNISINIHDTESEGNV